MKKLHTFDFGANLQLELLKSLLERDGIKYLVKGEHMFTAAGGVPFTECYPEVWVFNDADFIRARKIVNVWLQPAQNLPSSWRCENCKEWIEGQFDLCWSCEGLRPEDSLPG